MEGKDRVIGLCKLARRLAVGLPSQRAQAGAGGGQDEDVNGQVRAACLDWLEESQKQRLSRSKKAFKMSGGCLTLENQCDCSVRSSINFTLYYMRILIKL